MKVLKLFGGAIIATVVFLIAIWAMLVVVRFFSCGPNSADVKVMKPMAEKISEYIVKNGIPKSLKDIPDLPYRLEGCEKSEGYLNMIDGHMQKVPKEKAILYNFKEECSYSNMKLQFWLQKDLKENAIGISLNMNSPDETYIEYGGGAKEDGKIRFNEKNIGSSKTSGICNPMRQ